MVTEEGGRFEQAVDMLALRVPLHGSSRELNRFFDDLRKLLMARARELQTKET